MQRAQHLCYRGSKNMNKNIIAMLCITLIVTMPIAYSIDVEDLDERDTGESIVINVDDYEPKVVPASVLEENNEPVYAFLKGYTIGSLLGEEEAMIEPFYGTPKIKKITSVKQVEHNPYTVGGVRFMPPPYGKYTLDNLGTAVITLKKIEKEHEVPDNITVNVTARVYFDAERISGLGRQELVLQQDSDEDAWKQKKDIADYSFWSGRGYIRASKIEENEAKFEIYDSSFQTIKAVTLKKGGEPYGPITLRYASDLLDDRFRVQLIDVVDPLEERAEVEVNVGGETSKKLLKVGETLYAGSKWKLDYIAEGSENEKRIETMTLKDSFGNTKQVTKKITETTTRVDEEEEGKIIDLCTKIAKPIEDLEKWQKGIGDTLTIQNKKDLYCTAISEFKKLIEDYPDSKDGNGVLWKNRAYYHIGLTYKKLIDLLDLEKERAERSKAVEEAISAFEDSITNSNGEFITNARSRLFELKEENKEDISYGTNTFEEEGSYVQVKFLGIKPRDETKQPKANIRVYDTIKEGLTVGDPLVEDWFISEISENRVYLNKGSHTIKKEIRKSTDELEIKEKTGLWGIENGKKYEWILKYSKEKKLLIAKSTDLNFEEFSTGGVKYYTDTGKNECMLTREDEDKNKEEDRINVIIKKQLVSTKKEKEPKEETKILRLNQNVDVDGKDVKLLRVDLHKEAHIVIIPGTGKEVYSDSSFMIHIPIEKRAIKLSPEKIDEQINKTEAQIEKLDKIITRLDSVIRSWKALCLITFVTLTIKNSFGGGMARNQARQKVMQGTTENPGWRRYCEDNSGYGKSYLSYDACMLEYNDQIIDDIDKAQKSVEHSTKQKYTGEEESIDGIPVKNMREFEKADYGEKILSEEKARELMFFKDLSESCSDYTKKEDPKGNTLPNYCTTAKEKYDSLVKVYTNKEEMYGRINDKEKMGKWTNEYYETWLEKNKGMSISQYKSVRTANLIAVTKAEQRRSDLVESMGKTFTKTEDKTTTFTAIPGKIEIEGGKKYFYDSNNIKYKLEENEITVEKEGKESQPTIYKINDNKKNMLQNLVEGEDIYVYDSGGPSSEGTVKADSILLDKDGTGTAWIHGVEVGIELKGNTILVKSKDPSGLVGGTKITTDQEYSLTEQYRTTYAPGATVEIYDDNKPYCIPTKNGEFAKVKEYDKRGNPSVFEIWNVGPDGLLCTSDDIPVLHKSLITQQEHKDKYNQAERAINLALGLKEGQVMTIGEKTFRISKNKAQSETAKGAPKCQDVMDPTDCAILFGVCDPVMCPTSRCDFGGRWKVENVVKTGIIGSVVLCAPNFNLPYEPVPICLTGILAGLQNIRSILQGYVECLKTAKVHDKSVGICDKIRSVFICEILWQEAIAIWNIQGGIMSWLSDFIFGKAEGGGEYLNFQSSMQNVVESVKFFTADYAKTAFAAYNSRSLDEVGTEICKSAIFGKVPGMGDFFDQLTAPESPPQFTAVLSEMPWSESQKQSRYNVYYHIYAGEVAEATYSVFIIRSNDVSKKSVYATERPNGRRSTIEKGEYADFSVDFTADSGYDKVCVEINGKTDCGFGKVSSEFTLNYLDNLLVKDEVEREIDSEEDCVPDNPRTSPSLASLVMPGQPGLLSTGIVRVCSIQNPGQGTNQQNWKPIGSCGKDSEGHYLGTCWIDERTISIKDLNMSLEIAQVLSERGTEYTKEQTESYITLDEPETSLDRLNDVETSYTDKKDWGTLVTAIANYKDIIFRSKVTGASVEAQFNIAKVYMLLAEMLPQKQEEVKEEDYYYLLKTLESEDSTQEQKEDAAEELKKLIETGEIMILDEVNLEPIKPEEVYEKYGVTKKEETQSEPSEIYEKDEETKAETTTLPCKLISAEWGQKEAEENEEVKLIVHGENCDEDDRVFFRIYEDDGGIGDEKVTENPKPANFDKTGKATSTWVAEYQEDGWGIWSSDPEYRFTAEKEDEVINSGLLNVKKE